MDSLLESTKDMESTLPKWNFACWHKNQRDYQTGDKFDETGYEIYETARRHGAMILTAHQHLYARSKLMDNFEHHQISPENMKNDQDIESFKRKKKKHRKKNPKQPPSSNTLYLKSGSSFVVVSGLGGHSIRSWQDGLENNPWWAANAALNNGVNYGALLCTFYIDNNPRLAHCEFKDIDGTIWDSFYIRSPLQNEPVSRHSDIQVGDYNQQVFTTRHRQSRFTETTIRDVFDIKTIASNGSVSYSSRLLFPCSNESKTRHILKFKNLSTHNKSIHLQLMLSRSLSKWSNNKMEIVITSYTGDYIIDHINDSDVGEVYVSKDIKDILNIIDGNVEIIVHGTTLPLNGECIGRSVEGVSSESFCLSPTLAVIE